MKPPDLELTVLGTPGPQGSKSHDRHGNMFESSAKVGPWRDSVAWQAHKAMAGCPPLEGALRVEITFYLLRPKSVKRTYPSVKPDVDKYLRATLDAMKTGGVYGDDGQVCDAHGRKLYATKAECPGAVIRVWRME